MKKDIKNRQDIEILINQFYDVVKVDPVIGHFFSDVAKVNWEKHLPVMYDFWENILFYSGSYTGNPMAVHKHLHSLHPLRKEDFDHWLSIFKATAHRLFEGDNTELIIQRAQSIAMVMEMKIVRTGNNPAL